MTAIAALTLADGQATPVNHTFSPADIVNGVASYEDRSGGIAIGFPKVTVSVKAPTQKGAGNRNYRVIAKVTLPVLEQTSPSTATGIQPAPIVAYNLIGNVEIVLPERSTLAQRNDALAYVKNLLANAVFTNGVQNFERIY